MLAWLLAVYLCLHAVSICYLYVQVSLPFRREISQPHEHLTRTWFYFCVCTNTTVVVYCQRLSSFNSFTQPFSFLNSDELKQFFSINKAQWTTTTMMMMKINGVTLYATHTHTHTHRNYQHCSTSNFVIHFAPTDK